MSIDTPVLYFSGIFANALVVLRSLVPEFPPGGDVASTVTVYFPAGSCAPYLPSLTVAATAGPDTGAKRTTPLSSGVGPIVTVPATRLSVLPGR